MVDLKTLGVLIAACFEGRCFVRSFIVNLAETGVDFQHGWLLKFVFSVNLIFPIHELFLGM